MLSWPPSCPTWAGRETARVGSYEHDQYSYWVGGGLNNFRIVLFFARPPTPELERSSGFLAMGPPRGPHLVRECPFEPNVGGLGDWRMVKARVTF